MDISPSSLLERIRQGDKDAEQVLVKQYWSNLLFILNNRSHDPELAAELAQETFIVVINKARSGNIENPLALGAFIRQVGINLMIAAYRKDTRRQTDATDNIDIHPVDQPDLANSLNEKQLSEIVTQVIHELPTERDKELIFRFFIYGHEKRTICDEFSLTPAHFDRVLHRARSRLKQVLQIKLNVDATHIDLSHLLSIGLLFVTLGPRDGHIVNQLDYLGLQVRENQLSSHLVINTDLQNNSQSQMADVNQTNLKR